MPEISRLLVPGRTCWRIERSNRFALIIDAADYFRTAKAAMLKAQRRIMLIGWDFDTRIKFEPVAPTMPGPNRLGEFLSWLPKQRPGLHIYLLKWDLGMIQALGRGMTPLFMLNAISSRRVRLKLDSAHPVGAAHHQKIIVIDDCLAFCGGIDITADRWDTSEHQDEDTRRVQPNGRAYGPWHDATTAVDGDLARALGELARERWRLGTGERLAPLPTGLDCWPEELSPTIENVDVGIARTLPQQEGQSEVREIEALYLAAIRQARRTIYFESQYFACRKIAEALARRLSEVDGPEIVIVLPKTNDGWLEETIMGGARYKLSHLLWRSDVYKRCGIFYPVTKNGTPIYVHAKIMIVDDILLRVGSSNLNNRSMGFDTECDLALEVTDAPETAGETCQTILKLRLELLCEHLGVTAEKFSSTCESQSGSLLRTLDALSGEQKTLKRLLPSDVVGDDSVMAENELMDPERPPARLGERLSTMLRSLWR
jgi:phosphatidylserine/phosphatidylglycerophosphate/cardiolipin synthase-like enzyme